jgi:hypothetical protein
MSNQEPTYHNIDGEQEQEQTQMRNRITGFDLLGEYRLDKITSRLTPEILEAVMEIQTGVVNKRYIQKRQSMSYISHLHATETMNTVFQWDWEYQVLSYEIMEDGSALVHAQMDVYQTRLIVGELVRIRRRFKEVGSHEGYRLKDNNGVGVWDSSPTGDQHFRLWSGMSNADRILSATSRGLLRCMLRAFNYGANLYEEDNPPITPTMVWGELLRLGNALGISKDTQIAELKKGNFTKDNLIDQLSDAVNLYYNLAEK